MSQAYSRDVVIRRVTPQSLPEDLATGRVNVHPSIADSLTEDVGGAIDFFVAESSTGEPRGQVGVNWVGATSEQTRSALGLAKGEIAPNIAFMEVAKAHRRRGIGRSLLAAAYDEIRKRGHRIAFLSVAVGNTAARAFYESEGFAPTGLTRESPQHERNTDGTYGDPTIMTMDFLSKELLDSNDG